MTVLIAFDDSNSPRIMLSPLSPVATYVDQIVLLALSLVCEQVGFSRSEI
jgi:hypothetical protein